MNKWIQIYEYDIKCLFDCRNIYIFITGGEIRSETDTRQQSDRSTLFAIDIKNILKQDSTIMWYLTAN